MTQLNVNAPLLPDAAPLNGAGPAGPAVRAHQAGPPAALGNHHAVGRTIGRIFAAIFTLGISEAVRAILRAIRAEPAPAVPHLPQNRELSPLARIREANGALVVRLSGGTLPMVEQGKSKALTALGTFGAVDADAFQKKLEKAVRQSPAQVDDAALEALAENTARTLLMESAIRTALEEAPEGKSFTSARKNLLLEGFVDSVQAQALRQAPNAETATGLAVTVKDMVRETLRSVVDGAAVKQELFSAGLQSFRETTGLSEEQTASFNTWNLENKMNMTEGDIDQKFATPERPYARAGQDALREGWGPRAERFFVDRGAAYNSIAELGLPDGLKTSWRDMCLKTGDSIQDDTFSKSAALGRAVAGLNQLDSLTDPALTVDEKLAHLSEVAANLHTQWVDSFGEARLSHMGADERSLISGLVYDAVAAAKPGLLAALRENPDLVDALQAEMQGRVEQVMAGVGSTVTQEQMADTIGTNEALSMILAHLE